MHNFIFDHDRIEYLKKKPHFFIFSYACDDFIINDTPDSKLDSLRSLLVQIQQKKPKQASSVSSTNNSNNLMEVDTDSSSGTKDSGTSSTGSSSTGTGSGRRSSLRPRSRRRSQSMDSINGY